MATSRSYSAAIDALNSLQSNAAVIDAIRKSGTTNGEAQMVEGVEYLKRIGYLPSDLNRLNVLHITGTKGKGSTSAFTSSLLTTISPTAKIGLYTSPHMVAVRERIRIDGKPIEEELFAKYFWEVWDKLEADPQRANALTAEKPAYFRYLTIMAFHVFLQEKVDATILEVGVGGTYDSTNVVPQPIVTGICPLGIDHVFVLGKTIPEIAHQKGGIYKPDVPALAIEQPSEGLDVLKARATELKASSFTVVPEHPEVKGIKLGLAGTHQRSNASLALALVQAFLSSPRVPSAFSSASIDSPHPTSLAESTELPSLPLDLISPSPLSSKIVQGLEKTRWPGRCQTAKDEEVKELTWFLDGAHTVESLKCCGEWFAGEALSSSPKASRTLVFNCTSGRSGLSLLGTLLESLPSSSSGLFQPFDHVIFCTNTTYSSGVSKGDLTSNAYHAHELESLSLQHELAAAWKELNSKSTEPSAPQAQIHVLSSIQEAVECVRSYKVDAGTEKQALVTGSLHLVGGAMAVANLPL
ncbi:tetrahydrofolate synthase [Sporobolomyces salmoneus]|uniref:tetrahydrofolate synthase n=1 Tax=Sporobolomyces salmoneus TaxID=183962 RepID=UPI00317E9B0C